MQSLSQLSAHLRPLAAKELFISSRSSGVTSKTGAFLRGPLVQAFFFPSPQNDFLLLKNELVAPTGLVSGSGSRMRVNGEVEMCFWILWFQSSDAFQTRVGPAQTVKLARSAPPPA